MRTLVANSFHQISLCLVAGKRDFSRTPDFMTAPSSELWRPSFALRKAQLQSLAYGFLQSHPCPLFQNEGSLSSFGELHFQPTSRQLCRTCGCPISCANRHSF